MKLKASFLSALLLLLTTAPTSDGRSRRKRDLIVRNIIIFKYSGKTVGAFQNLFQDLLGESLFLSDSELKCLVCHWGADALVSYAHKGWDPTDFLSVATTLCHWLKIEDKVSDSPYKYCIFDNFRHRHHATPRTYAVSKLGDGAGGGLCVLNSFT